MENKEKKPPINSQYCFKVNAPETYWKTKCKKPKHPADSSLFSTLRWNLRTSVLELLILKLIQHKSNTASLQMGLHPKSFWHYTTQFLLLNCDQTEGKIIWDENIIRQPQSERVSPWQGAQPRSGCPWAARGPHDASWWPLPVWRRSRSARPCPRSAEPETWWWSRSPSLPSHWLLAWLWS